MENGLTYNDTSDALPTTILNLGIFAHVDAGKTSLTERLLFDHGVIPELGSVDTGTTQTDNSALERERGITIRSTVASFTSDDLQVNLVDTPGHPDFIAEVDRALSVLDGVVLVLSAVEGVQTQTRTLMRSLNRLRVPTVIFINKVDRMGARGADLVTDIHLSLTPSVVALNFVSNIGTLSARVHPKSLDNTDNLEEITEILSENDEELLERLLLDSLPSREETLELLIKQTRAALVHPVFFGSALTGEGVSSLTKGIKTLFAPKSVDQHGVPRGVVFAIDRIHGSQKIAYLKLYSGSLRERQQVTFCRQDSGGRISAFSGRISSLEAIGNHPYALKSAGRSPMLIAGNIGKIRGIPQLRIGDRLEGDGNMEFQSNFSPPSLLTVVRSQQPEQTGHLHSALMVLADEDPLIQARATGDGATSLHLYGEVQREVIDERLRREFGIEAIFEEAKPAYFERPIGVGEAMSEFDPHSHSEVFWATVGLRVEPAEPGKGNAFRRDVKWGTMPQAFHRAIEDAVFHTLEQGLSGWPVTDCVVTLVRVGFNAPTSVAADFRNLTPLVLMRALRSAGAHVYEPYHRIEIELPSDKIGILVSYLASLGGEITETSSRGEFGSVIGDIPARLVQKFKLALPELTSGMGVIWSRPGPDRRVRKAIPSPERMDGNPLDYDEYMRFLAYRRGAG